MMNEENTVRYCTIQESLEESLQEMKKIRKGKLPKKTWREYRLEIDIQNNKTIKLRF